VLAPDQEDALAFASSPLLETVLSLHVLAEPRHHALQHGWVRAMRRLPAPLRREIAALSFLYRYTLPNCVLPAASGADDDFAGELAALRALPTDVAAFELVRPIFDHGGKSHSRRTLLASPEVRARALKNARAEGRDAGRAAAQLFDDPAAFVERFARLLDQYWEAAFAAEWGRIEPLLANGIADAGRRIAADGIYPFLAGLAPALRVEPATHRFGLDIPHDHVVRLSPGNPLVLMTLHRRENWMRPPAGGPSPLEEVLGAVLAAAEEFPEARFVYPVHPNPNVQEPARRILGNRPNVHLLEPLSYLPFVDLLARSTVVLTDSGGVQEECPSLGVPVLVTRKTTERPEAVEAGVNFLVGTDRDEVLAALRRHLQQPSRRPGSPPLSSPYGDGRAGDRIRRAVLYRLGLGERPGEFKPVIQPGSALSSARRGERVAEGESS